MKNKKRRLIAIGLGLILLFLFGPVCVSAGAALLALVEGAVAELLFHFFKHQSYGIFILGILTWLYIHGMDLADVLVESILMNPNISDPGIGNILAIWVHLLQPVYVLAITIIGVYLLLMSGSPGGRAKAEGMLSKLIIGMIIIGMSKFWLKLMLDSSRYLAETILNMASPATASDVFKEMMWYLFNLFQGMAINEPDAALIMMVTIYMFAWSIFTILGLRYLVVTLLVILFPLTIFFYSFGATKPLGKPLMEQTIVWIFLQVVEAAVIAIIAIAVLILPPSLSEAGPIMVVVAFPVMNPQFILLYAAAAASLAVYLSPNFIPFLIYLVGFLMMIVLPLIMLRMFKDFLP